MTKQQAMYENSAVERHNQKDFHLASECPLCAQPEPSRLVPCPDCDGEGTIIEPCPDQRADAVKGCDHCNGSGKVEAAR